MSLRIIVSATDAAKANEIKEQFFKALYEQAGTKVTFEVPDSDMAGAEEIKKAAEDAGHEAVIETYEDPLESSDNAVDFW